MIGLVEAALVSQLYYPPNKHGDLTRSVPLPVLTRSTDDFRF